ncbi:MAG: serine/threonine protein kinase [Verrucomicrobia bacterium]|nr:serine/threonine protein kinase [Verrucomicrobiota bacterium]
MKTTQASVWHYRVVRPLGAGSMGEVYLAQDTHLDRPVALKILTAESARIPEHRRRFLTETKAVAALNHPNICTIHDAGETEDGRPFIAMELLVGETLNDRLSRAGLEMPELIEIGLQTADALSAVHARGIVHRDIKPSNLHVSATGCVKLLDFGLAKRLVVESATKDTATLVQTQRGEVLGTPNYMSPEQALGKEVDARTDLFSLGVVLYEMVTGRVPFAGESLNETIEKILHGTPETLTRFNCAVPVELERVILKCLRKAPKERYQSARGLIVDLCGLRESLR